MQRLGIVLGLILAVAAAVPALMPALAADRGVPGLVLDHIVLVERHGVRSPTKDPEAMSRYSAQRWPDWPVEPGILTDHGRRNVVLMGAWLRADYARKGLWPAKGCLTPGAAYVWADGKDQRTRVSGLALLDGAFPGCGLTDEHGPDGATDAVFSAVSAGLCPMDGEAARQSVLAQAGGDLDNPGPGYEAAKAALAKILDPASGPCLDEKGACFLAGHNVLRGGGEDGLKMSGPLSDASTVTEGLFLEYAEGKPAGEVGWGRAASAQAIASVMPLHDIYSDLMRRNPYIAAHNGAFLARAVLAGLDGRPALPHQGAAGTKIVAIAGHDTNLANLSGILGVRWTLKDQPDSTPPGAALVFEVWKDAGGERFVHTVLVYQTLEQMRQETPLDSTHTPGRMDVPVPGCADGPGGACRLATLTKLVEARLPGDCRAIEPGRTATSKP